MWILGQRRKVTFTVTDENGAVADPTNVSATLITPDGASAALTPTRLSQGVYKVDFLGTMPGKHTVVFVTSGVVDSADVQQLVCVRGY